jgi:hypothetical protein
MAQSSKLEQPCQELQRDKVFYVLFITFHEVLKAERLLKSHQLDVDVVPVPRSISSDCGVCIKSRSTVEILFGLLGHISGVKCYVFDGIEYKPGKAHPRREPRN